MKLSEIDSTLREIRVSPVRSLGQNFLHDANLARWIVEKADLTPEDYVVEIGPGLGALTEWVIDSGAYVLAIEKDRRLVEFLRKRFANRRVEVIHGDALDFDLRPLYGERRVKLLGNLPYYIASQLLIKFTEHPSPISLWLFMLQKEMARRISAPPRTGDYGALSLTMQLQHRVEYLRTVPASVFLPQPEVASAFVRITPRAPEELPPHDPQTFFEMVRLGFSQRRKQLRNLLREAVPEWEQAAAEVGFDGRARAEELSLEQWVALSSRKASASPEERAEKAAERFPVVDENDQVIRIVPRSEVHGNNLRHRAVHLFVFNRAGELFLQKRARCKDQHPLVWDSSAAGHVEEGEEYDETASRELQEELGVAAPLKRIVKLPCSSRTGWEFIWLYRAEHDGPFQLARNEIEHGEFFPVEIVERWIKARPADFAPGFIECWDAYGGAGVSESPKPEGGLETAPP
ncbi:MAG TPA: 16S rRNA (adenine(1518)-N(6)/adenine(1519)-N(6))-dimethyltransferase RsmA [Chthoniobacterales bacterium]|nr:16S rRNA (adenine(1518)-N(6)/adenine(1519)-N(6))-dimethyltransferase RsmA [Chthoniobacterales bacterium]